MAMVAIIENKSLPQNILWFIFPFISNQQLLGKINSICKR